MVGEEWSLSWQHALKVLRPAPLQAIDLVCWVNICGCASNEDLWQRSAVPSAGPSPLQRHQETDRNLVSVNRVLYHRGLVQFKWKLWIERRDGF